MTAAAAPGAVVFWQGHPQVRGSPPSPSHTQTDTPYPGVPVLSAISMRCQQLPLPYPAGVYTHRHTDRQTQQAHSPPHLAEVELGRLCQQLLAVVGAQLPQLLDEGAVLLNAAVQPCQLRLICVMGVCAPAAAAGGAAAGKQGVLVLLAGY